jgi:hypothetical protein
MKIDRARLFDLRVVKRNITAARVSREEYDSYLGSLTDAAANIMAREEGGDDDGYDRPATPRGLAPLPIRPLRSRIDDDDDDDDDDDFDDEDDDLDDEDDDLDGDDEPEEQAAGGEAPEAAAPATAEPEDGAAADDAPASDPDAG